MAPTPELKAEEIISFKTKQEEWTKPLRDRMEETYNFWRLQYFDIPSSEGKYRVMQSAKPRVFCDKVTSELAYAFVRLSIPIFKETKTERSREAMTEQTAYGLIALADDILRCQQLPCIQAQLAEDIPLRGWVGLRPWVYVDEADKTIVDIAVWDVRNVYWDVGSRGLECACNVRYASLSEIKNTYPNLKEPPTDAKGRVIIYDYWNKKQEIVVVHNEVVSTINHDSGYVPVLIMPVGSTRMRQSDKHDDTLKDVGEDFASKGGRIIWPQLSRTLTYYMTTVALGTHPVMKGKFNGPQNLPEFDSPTDLYEQGNIIPLDESKGQDLEPMFPPTLPKEAFNLQQLVSAEESRATAPDIFYGQSAGQETAQGTAMLIHAGMATLKNGQRAMEQAFAWLSNELISQVKRGGFNIETLQGVDSKKQQFTVKPKVSDLVTDRRFVCEVVIDSPQDILQNIGAADTLVKSGIGSMQTVRDKFLGKIFPDPDAEQAIIDRELARKMAGIAEWDALAELVKDDPNSVAAWRMFARIQMEAQQGQMLAQQGNPMPNPRGVPAIPNMASMSPRASMASNGKAPMQEMANENGRLANLGLERGR